MEKISVGNRLLASIAFYTTRNELRVPPARQLRGQDGGAMPSQIHEIFKPSTESERTAMARRCQRCFDQNVSFDLSGSTTLSRLGSAPNMIGF